MIMAHFAKYWLFLGWFQVMSVVSWLVSGNFQIVSGRFRSFLGLASTEKFFLKTGDRLAWAYSGNAVGRGELGK